MKRACVLLLLCFACIWVSADDYCASCHWTTGGYPFCAPDGYWPTESTHCSIRERVINGESVFICIERFSLGCQLGEWPPPY